MNYDNVASQFDKRYQDYDYSDIERYLLEFVSEDLSFKILEVGCGTGHWLEVLAKRGYRISGIDPSQAMLDVAKKKVAPDSLVLGNAESIPWPDGYFDRVFCINSFHHFSDRALFMSEAYRILHSGGGLMTIGLDPHTGLDHWSIYEYWPETLQIDKDRYLPTAQIRRMMTNHGFTKCHSSISRHVNQSFPAHNELEEGRLAENVTSQLGVLSDEQYRKGYQRLLHAVELAESNGKVLNIVSDLRLYGTIGWKA
jgi:ubiquinone/menaquinone biosynthesis C-methylase UbiE